jgi:excisionase family DNA binding protein
MPQAERTNERANVADKGRMLDGPNPLDDYISANEAATFLRVNRTTIYQLARRGELGMVKVANRWLVSKDSLEEYVNKALKGPSK